MFIDDEGNLYDANNVMIPNEVITEEPEIDETFPEDYPWSDYRSPHFSLGDYGFKGRKDEWRTFQFNEGINYRYEHQERLALERIKWSEDVETRKKNRREYGHVFSKQLQDQMGKYKKEKEQKQIDEKMKKKEEKIRLLKEELKKEIKEELVEEAAKMKDEEKCTIF